MNIEQLEYIVEVAKCNSLTKAAELHNITQSGISLSITALEKELGLKIFERSRRGVFPTEEGKKIINKTLEALNKIQEIKDEAYFQTNLMKGGIKIEGIPGFMPSIIRTKTFLKGKYPNLNIEITEKGSFEIIEDFRQNKIDAGFIAVRKDALQGDIGIAFEPLFEGKLVVCINKNSPLAKGGKIHPLELKKQTFILYNDDYVTGFMKDFTEKFGDVHVLFKTNNAISIEEALTEGLALTIGHDYSFLNYPPVLSGDLVILEVDPYPQEPIYFGWVKTESDKLSLISKQVIHLFNQEYKMNLKNGTS
ncbi:LysR family transcriptional regulator [Bacillus sp. AFS031507]|uniref:LysR family transcriptional regulator n=1 Tax=Bacillus sp. AFS031507 TaxID=2033496 RepID=UPI000BFD5DEE|nr:LysR family transcriptional regulator [Bacillus sp. AFS031507]PGY12971.1 LysR family transcriptional regulator [Bacillus sp. AFS031507]